MQEGQRELHLSFLDQQLIFRNYNRQFVLFPFADPNLADAAVTALRNGLAASLHQYPYLAGSLDVPDPATGRLRLLYPDPIGSDAEASRIFAASFEVANRQQFDYDLLAKDSFLPSDLPSEVFCPRLLRFHPGLDDDDPFAERVTSLRKDILVPVMAVQITFIPRGIVLSLWLHHSVADGTGPARLYEAWSAEVRAYGQPQREQAGQELAYSKLDDIKSVLGTMEPYSKSARSDPSAERRSVDVLAFKPNMIVNHPASQEHRIQLRQKPYRVVSKYFRIASSTISELVPALSPASELTAFLTSIPKNQTVRISRFVALTTLLWAHIIRVRSALLKSQDIPKATLAVVVDLRKHLGAPFTDYGGNLALSAKPTLPRAILEFVNNQSRLKSRHLAPLAQIIAQSLSHVNKNWAINVVAEVASSESIGTNSNVHELTFSNGPDLYITSWEHFGADNEWFIPGTSSAKPSAIRRAAWVSEGGVVVLPRRQGEDAPYEVLVSLAEEDMKAFEEEMRGGGWLDVRAKL